MSHVIWVGARNEDTRQQLGMSAISVVILWESEQKSLPSFSAVNLLYHKKHSETADFVPGAATWRTRRNICVVLDSGPFAPLCENYINMASSTKPEVLHCRHRKTAVIGTMYRRFGEMWTGFWYMRADKQTKIQTDKQKDSKTQYFAPLIIKWQ